MHSILPRCAGNRNSADDGPTMPKISENAGWIAGWLRRWFCNGGWMRCACWMTAKYAHRPALHSNHQALQRKSPSICIVGSLISFFSLSIIDPDPNKIGNETTLKNYPKIPSVFSFYIENRNKITLQIGICSNLLAQDIKKSTGRCSEYLLLAGGWSFVLDWVLRCSGARSGPFDTTLIFLFWSNFTQNFIQIKGRCSEMMNT